MPSSSERQPLASVFTFDQVFGPTSQTREIYRASASDIVDMTLEGINGTIFAYGQTSSGKTYTMQGSPSEPGIITMAMQDIFEKISQSAKCYVVKASYLEIYNENIKDLLLPGNENLKIHEHFSRGVHVGGLTELTVKSCAEVIALMNKGEINRHVGETNMNERSSRSHTILRIYIESRDVSEDVRSVKVSCLNLVDLAGSERASHTGAEGLRLKEGGSINKSLLALATVIARLSDGGDRGHIPYRDSKITRILQPSLGGNARTLIICTVTPSPRFVEDTISTLKFASRAKTIQNKPTVNEVSFK
ncbi:P-loop containing nucleoside triphosphate hydrolase protein [Zopfochytrium polystomum]|nr:P-loop containing nucleoside triphosphate hydrolase protein [Zopfochytrium polystomum]